MFTVKTLNKIAKIGLQRLDPKYFTQDDEAADPAAILVRSAKMLDYAPNPGLLCVARAGAGYNNIPVDDYAAKGVVVFNTPGANANAVKELAVCALILASRDVVGGIEWCKTIADKGDEVAALVEKGKSNFVGPELMGKTLGLIGLGNVGAKVANAASALGMKVLGYDPYLSDALRQQLAGIAEIVDDLDALYAAGDYISLHLPYTKDTADTICKASMAKMKDGVRIINIARGELVNDAEMAEALASGKVARYVTDFPNGNTVKMPGCVAIPHLGASTPESEDNCAVMAADQVSRYLLQGDIVNSVNLPNVTMERAGKYRAVVIAKADAALKPEGKAVTEKTRGAYKVILADADTPFDEAALAANPGVIRVRTL
ncbi:MAG: 3-phosphoglycerate dehydrogenase [Oscillospiraceae bacterium]|nr:3-phosphoglycerate dehydrogenase [Oscillospiraceae bacterium]